MVARALFEMKLVYHSLHSSYQRATARPKIFMKASAARNDSWIERLKVEDGKKCLFLILYQIFWAKSNNKRKLPKKNFLGKGARSLKNAPYGGVRRVPSRESDRSLEGEPYECFFRARSFKRGPYGGFWHRPSGERGPLTLYTVTL